MQAILVEQPITIVVQLRIGSVLIQSAIEIIVDTIGGILVPQVVAIIVDPIHRVFVDATVPVIINDDLSGEGSAPIELRLEDLTRGQDKAHRMQVPGMVRVTHAPGRCRKWRGQKQSRDNSDAAQGSAIGHG